MVYNTEVQQLQTFKAEMLKSAEESGRSGSHFGKTVSIRTLFPGLSTQYGPNGDIETGVLILWCFNCAEVSTARDGKDALGDRNFEFRTRDHDVPGGRR